MIRPLFFFLLFISVSITSAQDIILKQNGEKLKVELIQVTDETIYYKNFGIRNAVIKQLNFSEGLSIYYANKTNHHDNNTSGPLDKSISRKSKDSNKVNAEEKDQEEPTTSTLKVNSPRIGYIGIATGTAIPIGEFAYEGLAKTGITNTVNFGCRLSEKMGIAATWFASSNPIDLDNYGSDSYRGLLIGPSVSIINSKKLELDIRAMVGYSMTTLPEKIYNYAKYARENGINLAAPST